MMCGPFQSEYNHNNQHKYLELSKKIMWWLVIKGNYMSWRNYFNLSLGKRKRSSGGLFGSKI